MSNTNKIIFKQTKKKSFPFKTHHLSIQWHPTSLNRRKRKFNRIEVGISSFFTPTVPTAQAPCYIGTFHHSYFVVLSKCCERKKERIDGILVLFYCHFNARNESTNELLVSRVVGFGEEESFSPKISTINYKLSWCWVNDHHKPLVVAILTHHLLAVLYIFGHGGF